MYIKQLLDSDLVISRIIKVFVSTWPITLTSTFIIPDITKTSSNNCLVSLILTVSVVSMVSFWSFHSVLVRHAVSVFQSPLPGLPTMTNMSNII